MADTQNDSKVINKNDARFPAYMDFNNLRSEGIEYLGKLAGKIWTDHNVHDPGITILEMLCYAILDLGYRTNLPAIDIFSRDPDNKNPDSNFYTPAEILSCNPLTLTDHRKLLADIDGIKNAWLVPATDVRDFCRTGRPEDFTAEQDPLETYHTDNNTCEQFLNGLYHVYIDLEKDVEEEYRNNEYGKKKYLESIVTRVRNALMRHRNLCEDIEDIFFLCKLPVGVCADIDLEEQADIEKVYLEAAKALREFLTPAPRFYTLPELLARNKSMDEIFAGRPYNIRESHGFVDTEEFEEIRLKKEIHLSDLYTVLQQVKGIRAVKNLALRLSPSGNGTAAWKVSIPENHVPDFRIDYSKLTFSRGGLPVTADFKKFNPLLGMNFTHTGKIPYRSPSPYLDAEIPRGVYRKDLAEYYSIQNEFPRVYGIQEGGLPDNATDLRKSQALQIKGYLLFFDQLLANYLSQLGSMRTLFSNRSPDNKSEQHTYFINQLTNVPEIEKLLRFQNGKNGGISGLGTAGGFQASPVDRSEFFHLIEENKLKMLDLEAVFSGGPGTGPPPLIRQKTFDNTVVQDVVISQLKNDLYYGVLQTEIVTKADNCVYYYLVTSSESVVLLSNKYFPDEKTARRAASSVAYIGTLDENYRSFTTSSGDFSFDIELNIESFSGYLQLIAEDRSLYLERREAFVKHLLTRFAEKFADYALLSFRSIDEAGQDGHIEESRIYAAEKFLQHYPDISSNRGRAFDYLRNGWNNDNVSGFEKRVKAITGIGNWGRTSLCNFIVDTYDEQYTVKLTVGGKEFFSLGGLFDSREDAQRAAQAIFESAKDMSRFSTEYIYHENAYTIHLRLDQYGPAVYHSRAGSSQEANALIQNLSREFNPGHCLEEPFVSQYIYRYRIQDSNGKSLLISKNFYETEEVAHTDVKLAIAQVNERRFWDIQDETATLPAMLYYSQFNSSKDQFINLDAFKIDINDTIIGKPDRFTYDVLDKNNQFKFTAVPDFDTADQARAHCYELLARMLYEASYQVRKISNDRHDIYIIEGDQDLAVFYTGFQLADDALAEKKRIISIIRQSQYDLLVKQTPYRWKFRYVMGYEPSAVFPFESIESYPAKEKAAEAAELFARGIPGAKVKESKGELFMSEGKVSNLSVKLPLTSGHDPKTIKAAVVDLLEFQKTVYNLAEQEHEAFAASIQVDEKSRQGRYVYRLVDKDNVPAAFSGEYNSVKAATQDKNVLSRIKCTEYRYLEICLGGNDIIHKRKEALTNTSWYHYVIRCRNRFMPSGEELILFESTLGFATEEEAEKAFLNEYLHVLAWGADPAEYGTKISLVENPVHSSGPCVKAESVVFIPESTMNSLGSYPDDSIRKIQAIAGSYPVKIVEFQSPAFRDLFPCEPREEDLTPKRCEGEKKKHVYYFRMEVPSTAATAGGNGPHYWRSTGYYEDPAEARKAFTFFVMLLCYPGNFFVDCDPCDAGSSRMRIYIREVLAESARRFPTEESAWGQEGVQRMISVAQSSGAFHTFARKDRCFSFFIACEKSLILHPCQYDSAERRDIATSQLYRQFTAYTKSTAYKFAEGKEGIELFDAEGRPFALLPGINHKIKSFTRVAEFVNFIRDGSGIYIMEEGIPVFLDNEHQTIARAVGGPYAIADWKSALASFAYFFPLVRKGEEYCIELKLPGFNTYATDNNVDEIPCGCGEKVLAEEPHCYIAWMGSCCYRSPQEAYRALAVSLQLLEDYENYRPVMGCSCHDFGIALYFTQFPVSDAGDRPSWWTAGEIVAFNPQCYPNPDVNCTAIERAWKLINAEGLHLVEHILLRPRCEGDCECRNFRTCENRTGCNKFRWQEETEDPCAEKPLICFEPGEDPYSFIATVVLPAWPDRFKDPNNRLLLEHILHREAPAHVLIRILWLAPHDFCCFENLYKRWIRWLGVKKNCGGFDPCDLITFLFDRIYEPLREYHACDTCDADTTTAAPCFEAVEEESDTGIRYLNQINELFCWRTWNSDYVFEPCLPQQMEVDIIDDPASHSFSQPVVASAVERKPPVPAIAKLVAKPGRAKSGSERTGEKRIMKDVSPSTMKARHQWMNSRLAHYKDIAGESDVPAESKLTDKVKAFLNDPDPPVARLMKLLSELRQPQSRKKASPKMSKKRRAELAKISVACYLDKVCFKGVDPSRIVELRPLLQELKKGRLNATEILRYWNPEEVKQNLPGADTEAIVDVFNTKTIK